MDELLVATRNKGKVVELQKILGDMHYRLVSLDEIANIPSDIEETGTTFEENAEIKARAYGLTSNMPVVADDSGLVVDALDGRPGVYSARYAPTVKERNKKLLGEMEGIPAEKRVAKYVCVVCFFDPKKNKLIFGKGEVKGRIADKQRGSMGFGYDPVFIADELGKTFGEVGDTEKNKISHRARALTDLKNKLSKQ